MNLGSARNELQEPPRIGWPILLIEGVGLLAVSYLLVSWFA